MSELTDVKLESVKAKTEVLRKQMQTNVQIAIENVDRGQDLEISSEKLAHDSLIFVTGSTRLKNKMCFRKWKLTALIVLLIIIILLIIILPLALKNK